MHPSLATGLLREADDALQGRTSAGLTSFVPHRPRSFQLVPHPLSLQRRLRLLYPFMRDLTGYVVSSLIVIVA